MPPAKILDVRALVGDTTDNIPGVKGIGEKGAAKLIAEYGSLEALLDHAGDVANKRAREALQTQAAEARLSKRLATLADERRRLRRPGVARRARARSRAAARALRALRAEAAARGARRRGGPAAPAETPAQGGLFDAPACALRSPPLPRARRRPLRSRSRAIRKRSARSRASSPRSRASASRSWGSTGRAGCRPSRRASRSRPRPTARSTCRSEPGLATGAFAEALAPALGGESRWISRESKRTQTLLAEHGFRAALPAFDVELAAFLLDPSAQHGTQALASQHLGFRVESWEELAGPRREGDRAVARSRRSARPLGGRRGVRALRLERALVPRLERDGLAALYREVELPAHRGAVRDGARGRARRRVRARAHSRRSSEASSTGSRAASTSSPASGSRSPRRSSSSPCSSRSSGSRPRRRRRPATPPTRACSSSSRRRTSCPPTILAHRRLAKLRSTYVEALPPLVNPRTGRIHPTFTRPAPRPAASRRRTRTSRTSRSAARRACGSARRSCRRRAARLLAADYSQVELRILAHYSGRPEPPRGVPHRRGHPPPHRRRGRGDRGRRP